MLLLSVVLTDSDMLTICIDVCIHTYIHTYMPLNLYFSVVLIIFRHLFSLTPPPIVSAAIVLSGIYFRRTLGVLYSGAYISCPSPTYLSRIELCSFSCQIFVCFGLNGSVKKKLNLEI